jgi:hypothetical protein
MPRNNRPLSFPRAFSIMASLRTGKVIDLLRVIASTKQHRVSAGEVTRRLLAKGILLEACEYAHGYATGKPVDIAGGLLAGAPELGEARVGRPEEEILWAVLARMWPELSQKIEKIDVQSKRGREAHRKLQAGPPLTGQGRAKTVEDIRSEALADVQAGVKAPAILPPPRTVEEAFAQARQQTEADRLAIARGVPVSELLARTRAGESARMPQTDETAGASGWASEQGKQPDRRTDIAAPQFVEPKPDAQPEAESYGAMLKRLRGGS